MPLLSHLDIYNYTTVETATTKRSQTEIILSFDRSILSAESHIRAREKK